jgi:hypothetical protein
VPLSKDFSNFELLKNVFKNLGKVLGFQQGGNPVSLNCE